MNNVYLDQPCDRCGSKRRVGRIWKEKIATLTGTAVVEHTQIVCVNKACQITFEKTLAKEARKRKALKKEKDAKTAARKMTGKRKRHEK